MASPTLNATGAASHSQTAATSKSITLPASGITAGDTIWIWVATKVATGNVTISGYQRLVDVQNAAGSVASLHGFYKKADGTENGTSVTADFNGVSSRAAWVVLTVEGAADPTVTAPETGTPATLANTNAPNPPAVTPSGGSNDYLALTAFASSHGRVTSGANHPAGYTATGTQGPDNGTATNIGIGTAAKAFTGTTDNPGTFTTTGTGVEETASATVAFYPAASSQNVTAVTLTASPSLPAATLRHEILAATLSATPSLPAATLRHSLTAATLTVTPSQPAAAIYNDGMPATYTGWYDATKLVLSNNDPVGTWADSSGNGRDFTQGTAGNKPLYKTAIQNGKAIVRFDGSDDFMKSAAALSSFITASAGTVFSVFKMLNPQSISNDYQRDPIWADDGGYVGMFGTHPDQSSLAVESITAYNWDGSDDKKDVAYDDASFHIAIWRHSGGNLEVAVDGTTFSSVASGDTEALTGVLAFGKSANSLGAAELDLGEVIFYNTALGSTDTSAVYSYLATKWGIAASQSLTAATLTTTPSQPAATLRHELVAATLTVSPSQPAATLLNAISAVTLTVTPSLPQANVFDTIRAVTLTTTPSQPAATLHTALTAVTLTTTPTQPAATLRADLTAVTLTITPSQPTASVLTGVLAVTLTVTPSQPAATILSGDFLPAETLTIDVTFPRAHVVRHRRGPIESESDGRRMLLANLRLLDRLRGSQYG